MQEILDNDSFDSEESEEINEKEMEVLLGDQYATRFDYVKEFEKQEKHKAKMISDFKKERSLC